jgi:hypothetical protein
MRRVPRPQFLRAGPGSSFSLSKREIHVGWTAAYYGNDDLFVQELGAFFMHNSQFTRPDIALFCGILMFVMAVGGTFAGKLPGRFGEVAYRAKDPKQYWSALAVYYLAAIGFIGYYLYKVHAL